MVALRVYVSLIVATTLSMTGAFGVKPSVSFHDGWFYTPLTYGTDVNVGMVSGAYDQTVQAMKNIQSQFAEVGLSLEENAASCLVYLNDINRDFDEVSAAYKTFFPSEPHPSRSPPGVTLALEGAIAGIQCIGTTNPRVKISPADFFATDFNSQGILAGEFLFTAGQIGSDPVTEAMVEGGMYYETERAVKNLQQVFSEAFPSYGDTALSTLATVCQLQVGSSDLASIALAKKAFQSFFPLDASPAVTLNVINPGFDAAVEVACTGINPALVRKTAVLGSSEVAGKTHGFVLDPLLLGDGGTRYVHLGLQTAPSAVARHQGSTDNSIRGGHGHVFDVVKETHEVLRKVEGLFSQAFPWLGTKALATAAKRCSVFVSSRAHVQAVTDVLSKYFEVLGQPATTLVVVGLEGAARVGVECEGASVVFHPFGFNTL